MITFVESLEHKERRKETNATSPCLQLIPTPDTSSLLVFELL